MAYDLNIPENATASKVMVKIGGYTGFVVNGVSLLFTLFLIGTGTSGVNESVLDFSIINSIIGLGLSTWVLMRYSFIASILLLVFYFISKLEAVETIIKTHQMGYDFSPIGIAWNVILVIPYVLAVIGSFNLYRLRKYHDPGFPPPSMLWLHLLTYVLFAIYFLTFVKDPALYVANTIADKFKPTPEQRIVSTRTPADQQASAKKADSINIDSLQKVNPGIDDRDRGNNPVIYLRNGFFRYILVVPINNNYVLLMDWNKAVLWDTVQQRTWPVTRDWRWYNDEWPTRYRAVAIGERVLIAGFLRGNTNTPKEDKKLLPTRQTDLLLFDPSTKNQRPSLQAKLPESRGRVLLTTLSDRHVLVTGGLTLTDRQYSKSTELITIQRTGLKVERLPEMQFARIGHKAVRLSDGRIIVIGGKGKAGDKVEIFDPRSRSWRSTKPLNTARSNTHVLLMNKGRVLVVSGENERHEPVTTMELWDPVTEEWETLTGPSKDDRITASVVRLDEHRILVAGGRYALESEIYDLRNSTWKTGPLLDRQRNGTTAVLARNNKVHVIGGMTGKDSYYRWNGSVEVLTIK